MEEADLDVAFRALGPLEVVVAGRVARLGSAKLRLTLAALLVNANAVVSADRLVGILWGDEPPATATSRVQSLVYRLRRLLTSEPGGARPEDVLATRPPGYLLRVEPGQYDVARFEQLIADARRDTDPAVSLATLNEALSLWRGPAFAEVAFDDFARTEAARLEELRMTAAEDRVDAKLRLGQHAELVGELEQSVAVNPVRERVRAQLMLALYRSGREVEALQTYQNHRRYLASELGLEPSAALRRLEERILQHEPNLDWVAPPSGTASSPPPLARSLPTGTVTFLFTDLENSTPLWEAHPTDMKAALARHDEILRETVAQHDGQIVKTSGDGIHAVFVAASDAVAMAVAALRAFDAEPWGATGPLVIRIGMHTGAAELRDGDYYGTPVNRASRVMAAAHGGQAVLSHASAELVRGGLTDGLDLLDLGEHRLKGLARSERIYQLAIAGLRTQFPPLQSVEAFPGRLPLPLTPFARDDQALAGREAELDALERAWTKSTDGARQVALVAGEPGIGKTRLVGELTRRAYAHGAVVLYGRCDEEAIMPYQPVVEALRPYVAACPPSTLRESLHGLEPDLVRAFPELVGRMPELSVLAASNPVIVGLADREAQRQTERYRLFEVFATLLTGIAAAQPAVLVLDDVHWADNATLLLFRHLLRATQGAALFVVACYRDVEVARGEAFSDLLADLRREQAVSWLKLSGLSESASGDLVVGVAGHQVAPALVGALHRETGGNPFFLEEVVRHLIETDALSTDGDAHVVDLSALDMPQSVRDVIARRLRRLPPEVNEVMNIGAVVGREFDAALIVRAAQRPADEVLDTLDEATDAGLVVEHPEQIGRYSFSHALIQQTLYAELKTAHRVRLHARVGTAIEESAAPRERSAAVLAHHFAQALPLVGAPKAIEYSRKAGYDAVAEFAFEDALAFFERALGLLEQVGPVDTTEYVELLTELADAMVFVDERAGVQAALRAVDAARANGSSWQLGRAVAVLAEPNSAVITFRRELPLLFDEAHAALGSDHPGLRARLLAREAFKYTSYQLQGRDGRALARTAVGLARDAGDPLTLTDALFALGTSLEGTVDLDERVALGEELVALGHGQVGRTWTYGLRILAGTHLERAEGDALQSAIGELARVGEELRWLPARAAAAQWRGTHALLEGRFDDLPEHWEEMNRYRRAYGGVTAMRSVQYFFLARERGELDGAVSLDRMAEQAGGNLYAHALHGLAQLELGEDDGAVRCLDLLERDDFHNRATEGAWVAVLALLAEIAATGGSPRNAQVLHDLLLPFAGRLVTAQLGLACLGAGDRYLGMLSTVLERWDDAEAEFERAAALEASINGRPLLARTGYWRARFLRARGGPRDAAAASAMLHDVVEETSFLGMQRLCAQAEDLLTV